MDKKDFLKLINDQRKQKSAKKFEGTLIDYVELVQDNPGIAKLAHKRLYDAIVDYGVNEMPSENPRKRKIFNNDSVKIYDYFKNEFFGMENVIQKIMRFLKGAALRGEESRQVLLLMGPVGAGKSALVEHIKHSLEGENFYHLKDDTQRGEPLQLIPRSLREVFE